MKITRILSALAVVIALTMSACSKSSGANDNAGGNTTPVGTNNYPKPTTQQGISDLLSTAIKSMAPSVYIDMSAMGIGDNLIDMTMSNAYSSALSKDSSLKYAYQIVDNYSTSAKVVLCTIKYMPYKLGIDPNSVAAGTTKINTYNDLIAATNANTAGTTFPIAIMNKNLDVNTIQLILNAQCGYGFLVYTLGADGTTIVCAKASGSQPNTPANLTAANTSIKRCKDSVTAILARITTPSMTNDQKFKAIYDFVSQPTAYDNNYGGPNMDFNSQNAYGVFVNHLAVCSGYSWAINMLTNAAGIQCYNISGYGYPATTHIAHAWNNVNYNGAYFYFDATWDHSFSPTNYHYFSLTEPQLLNNLHAWNDSMINALVAEK